MQVIIMEIKLILKFPFAKLLFVVIDFFLTEHANRSYVQKYF